MSRRLHVHGAQPGPLVLTGAPLHYLHRVLRLEAGATLEVFDQGQAFDAKISSVDVHSITLELGPPRHAPSLRLITVVQGLPKADKFEWVLQKATELGASSFAPVSTTRSIVKLEGREEKKLERWRRIVEEAARQSGRSDVPEVLAPLALADRITALRIASPRLAVLVLDEEERVSRLSHLAAALEADQPIALIIGPEGGLTREEVATLKTGGAHAVTLGRFILRTETAALAALAVLRHVDGDFA